jgi:hypothetical protein
MFLTALKPWIQNPNIMGKKQQSSRERNLETLSFPEKDRRPQNSSLFCISHQCPLSPFANLLDKAHESRQTPFHNVE